MSERSVTHIVTLVSRDTLCGIPVQQGMRPLILGTPLISQHPVCEACTRAGLDRLSPETGV